MGPEDLLMRWRADPDRHGIELGALLYTLAYRFIRKRVPEDWDAQDLAQSTVTTALIKHESFTGGSLHSWIYKIAHNQIRNHQRRQQRDRERLRTPSREPVGFQTTAGTRLSRQRQMASLRRRIGALTTPYQQVILWHLRGLEPREIAAELGLAPATARVRLHRAIKQLENIPTPPSLPSPEPRLPDSERSKHIEGAVCSRSRAPSSGL